MFINISNIWPQTLLMVTPMKMTETLDTMAESHASFLWRCLLPPQEGSKGTNAASSMLVNWTWNKLKKIEVTVK